MEEAIAQTEITEKERILEEFFWEIALITGATAETAELNGCGYVHINKLAKALNSVDVDWYRLTVERRLEKAQAASE